MFSKTIPFLKPSFSLLLVLSLLVYGCSEEPKAPVVVDAPTENEGDLIKKFEEPAGGNQDARNPETREMAGDLPVLSETGNPPEAAELDSPATSGTEASGDLSSKVEKVAMETSGAIGVFKAEEPDSKPAFSNDPVSFDKNGFALVTFDRLASFEYEVPDDPVVLTNEVGEVVDPKPEKDQIPEHVKKLNKKRVALEGFMLPLKVEDGLVTELLMMRDQSMCCFGTVPKINEWVSVRMTNQGIKHVNDVAVTMYGTLKVGEIYENGYLVGIYEMDGESMAGPLDF